MEKNKESEVSAGNGKEIDYPWEIEQEKILKEVNHITKIIKMRLMIKIKNIIRKYHLKK
jgi:hypothetical protein